jgi:hypothetical protein
MKKDSELIAEAYATQVPATPVLQKQPAPIATPTAIPSQNNQEEIKKETTPVKDWIRLPFIDTPFKARMAAVLIVELIHNLTRDQGLRDLVLKEIRTSNRLQKRR